MSGTRISTISLILLLSVAAYGFQPEYFPLQPGNQWIYHCAGATCGSEPPVLEILKWGEFGGRWYSLFKGFDDDQTWLRQDPDGKLWALDPETRQESLWYDFAAEEGAGFFTGVHRCSPGAFIESRHAAYKGPIGEVTWALKIRFEESRCRDAGLSEEFFLPWIGLVHRTETTIAGPRSYDLIYSRTNGVTNVTEPHLTFGLAIDQSAYVANLMPPVPPDPAPTMLARITLRNTTADPIRLIFPSSQRFDLEIRNENGDVVYRWSEGKPFLMVYGEEEFSGERNYAVIVRLTDKEGKPLAPGKYVAAAWVATAGKPALTASVAFEMRWVM